MRNQTYQFDSSHFVIPIKCLYFAAEVIIYLFSGEMLKYFEHVVITGSDPEVTHGKPHPECFLVAANRFKEKPKPENVNINELLIQLLLPVHRNNLLRIFYKFQILENLYETFPFTTCMTVCGSLQ